MSRKSKYNDTSVRVVETLKILSKKPSSVQDIVKIFAKNISSEKFFTNEVVLKYINTLKVAGFKINKEKDKYVLHNNLVQFDFSEQELAALKILESFVQNIPEESKKTELHKFIHDIEDRFSNETRLKASKIDRVRSLHGELLFDMHGTILKKIEHVCYESQKIKLYFYDKNKNMALSNVVVEPKEIMYRDNKVYFSVYNPVSAQIQSFDLADIVKVEQLPLRAGSSNMFSSVSFLLKESLASAYKLHKEEKILKKNIDGSIVVINYIEDRQLLLQRVLRYGEFCEVLSPKTFRDEVRNTVNRMLQNYN